MLAAAELTEALRRLLTGLEAILSAA